MAHQPNLWTARGQTFLGTDRRAPDQVIRRGEYLLSADARFALTLQSDGNLVVYGLGGRALWNSQTNGLGAVRGVMQGDGNFVLRRADNVAVWHTHTGGQGQSRLVMHDPAPEKAALRT